MASRSLFDLVHPCRILAEKFFAGAESDGITLFCVCTYRSPEEQNAYYAQGRLALTKVNSYRIAARLAVITERENKVVTQSDAAHGRHCYRTAFDFGVLVGGRYDVKGVDPGWMEAREIGLRLGLKSLYPYEVCHLELSVPLCEAQDLARAFQI